MATGLRLLQRLGNRVVATAGWCYGCGMAVKKKNGKNKEAAREPAKTPGDILRRSFMEPLELTAYRVSKDIGIPQITLSQILRGTRGISPGVATRLGRYFDVAPKFWLGMQADYDLARIAPEAPEMAVGKCAAMGERQFTIAPPDVQQAPAQQRAVVIKFPPGTPVVIRKRR